MSLALPWEPKPGQSIRASDVTSLIRAVRANTPRTAAGMITQAGSNGTTQKPIRRPFFRPPLLGTTQFPWQVSMRPRPGDSTGTLFDAMVNTNSDILYDFRSSNTYGDGWIPCNGLGTWFPFIATDVIAVFIPLTSGSIVPGTTVATIQSYGNPASTTTFDPKAAAWAAAYNSFVYSTDNTSSTSPQAGINIMLAYSTPDLSGNPYLVQAQFDHLFIEAMCIDGRPALYDRSHRRRYGITAPGV